MNIYTAKSKEEFNPKDYTFAVYVGNSIYCNCGAIYRNQSHSTYGRSKTIPGVMCEKCDNKLVYFTRSKGRFVIPYIEIVKDDSREMVIRRINLSVSVSKEEDSLTVIKENMIRVLSLNMLNETVEQRKNNIPIDTREEDFNGFFNGIPFSEVTSIAKSISGVDSSVYNYLEIALHLNQCRWGRKNSSYGFAELVKMKEIQILASAKYPNLKRFVRSNNGWARNQDGNSRLNSEGKSPSEIFQVSKSLSKIYKDYPDITIEEGKKLVEMFKDANKIKEMMSIVMDESRPYEFFNSLSYMSVLQSEYGYTDMNRLMMYLFREIRMSQGIASPRNGVSLLRDYVRMSKDMELDFDRYPKSLKREHDVVMLNYKVRQNEMQIKKFKEVVSKPEYADLVWSKSDYSIITPTQPEDLIAEGNQLSHCLSSYVSDVSKERCKIFFLRDSSELNRPLVSVEVRGDNVRQARGKSNRRVTSEESEFISKWAKEKGLLENYYK